MLIEEAIQSIQSLYNKGISSKDSRLSNRQIYASLINARNIVLRQQITKRQKVSEYCYQPLSCIALEKAPIHECPCVPTDGFFILRSVQKLPKIMSSFDKPLIQYVTYLDGSVRFDKTTFENVKYQSGNKLTANKPRFYIKNDRLYITTITQLKGITAKVLAEDPIEAHLFSSLCEDCNTCECKDYTEIDFYTDRDSFNSIKALAEKELIFLFGQMKEDKFANAAEDQNGKAMVHQPE